MTRRPGLFYAVIDVTYLPRYFPRPRGTSSYYSPLYTQMSLDQFLAIFRIILNVAAAVALIQCAERVIRWLVKDSFVKQTPNQRTDTPPLSSALIATPQKLDELDSPKQ